MYGWSDESQTCTSRSSTSQSQSTARRKQRRRARPDSDVDSDSDNNTDTDEPSANTQQSVRVQSKPWLIEFEKYLRMPEGTMPITKDMDLINWWGVCIYYGCLLVTQTRISRSFAGQWSYVSGLGITRSGLSCYNGIFGV